jgi:hypothetical protein
MQDGNSKNNAGTKFYRGKVHRRMLAGDSTIKRIVALGDFGEIKDWVQSAN